MANLEEYIKKHIKKLPFKLNKQQVQMLNDAVNDAIKEHEEEQQKIFTVMNFRGEKWRIVEGYDGHYKVSSFGRFKSNWSGHWRIIKGHNIKGYTRIEFTKNGIRKSFMAHDIIAKVFIPNPENKPYVNHKNGKKSDNRMKNLEWTTHSENIKHAWNNGLCKPRNGEDNPAARLNNEQVRWIRANYRAFDEEFGQKPLAKKFNVSISCIQHLLYGKTYRNIN